ncbi:MAG: carboxypeptidase regulatory-like domain-containing protein [Acidobacteriota bacterium]
MSKRKSFHSLCSLVLALCMGFGAIPALGQSQASTGQIAGVVTDAQGGSIPKATVTATNKNTGMARSSVSNDEGYYAILLLPPGIYNVAAEASGFAASTISDVEVSVGRTRDINISMGVSGVTEVVSVTAGAIQVQTTRSEADSVLNQQAIENLPINGRRFQDFVTLTPMAQVEPSRQQISLAGQRGINSNINVDGTDYNNPFFGGIRGGERSNFAFTIPQESIKEFQVVASGYSAEFGRSTGGIVNAVTKSGSNAWHGSGFYNIRPQQWAKKPQIVQAAEDDRNLRLGPTGVPLNFVAAPTLQLFGGSFGGPVKKDKAFFFVAYEQQRFRNKRQVFFDNLSAVTPGPLTQEAIDFYSSLQEPFTQTNDAKAFTGRFDYEINANHRFNIRYGWSKANALNSTSVGNALFPTISNALSNNGTENDGSNSVVGQFTSFFSSTLVNEFRGQWVREERPRPANAIEPNVTDFLGTYGTNTFLGQNTQFDRRIQAADSLTWSKGSHTLKFGGEYNHIFISQLFGFNQTGSFNIAGTNANTVAEILSVGGTNANRFDTTDVTFLRQIGNLMASYGTDEIAFFGQDSWRIKPNFTLNYGVRWEGQYNPTPEANNTTLLNKVNGAAFPNVFPSGHRADPTKIADNAKQIAPRLGFAWDPKSDGKTVVRGYTGIYYARTPLLLFAAAVNNWRIPAGDLSVQLPFSVPSSNPNNTVYEQLKLIGIDLNTFTLGNLPDITPDKLTAIANALGLVVDPFTGAQPIFNAADYKNPRAYQGGLGVERQVSQSLSVGADFTYVHTVFLQRNRDINVPKPVLRSVAVDPAQRPFYGLRTGTPRPISTLGQVQVRESTAKSLYRAITLRAKFQKKWGQFNTFYTLSKNLSDDDNERSAGGFSYEDFYRFGPEYSNSNIDRRHQFVASPVFYLPHGIDFSSAIRMFSGTPIDASSGITDANGDRGGPDRPYLGPGVPFQRNAYRNRAIYGFDVHGAKRIEFAEGKRVVLTLDVFNVLNLQNNQIAGAASTNFCIAAPLPAPNNVIPPNCGFLGPTNPNFLSLVDHLATSPRFGKLLLNNNPGAPLQVQVGARFQF